MQLYQLHEDEGQQTVLSTAPAADTSILQDRQLEEGEDAVIISQPVTDLLATAEKQKTQRKRLAFFALCLAIPVALLAAFPRNLSFGLSYCLSVILLSLIAGIFFWRYGTTTGALARLDDMRMVGSLIDRLHLARIGTYPVVRQALMRLLPRLKASDASLLTPSQKGHLAHHLAQLARFQRDKEFQVVILRAFEQVGDAQAIPVVESILKRRPHWAAQEQVHAAAAECLPFLHQRAQEENTRQTLLRATGRREESDGQLLRPAVDVADVSTRELLRADQPPEPTPEQTGK